MKKEVSLLLDDEEKLQLMEFAKKKDGFFTYVELLMTAAYRAGQSSEGIKERHFLVPSTEKEK